MCGHIRRDYIRNEDIIGRVKGDFVVDKMQKTKLKRFEHTKEIEEHEYPSERVCEIDNDKSKKMSRWIDKEFLCLNIFTSLSILLESGTSN